MLPEQLLEIGCSEIGVYYIKIDNGYLLAFFCKIKRHIDGYICFTRAVMTGNYINFSEIHFYPLTFRCTILFSRPQTAAI